MMMMARRIASRFYRSGGRDFCSRSYNTDQSTPIKAAGGLWGYISTGCRVLITGSAGVAGYKLGDYITPIDNSELRDKVKKKEADLQELTEALEFVHEFAAGVYDDAVVEV